MRAYLMPFLVAALLCGVVIAMTEYVR